MCVEQSTSGEMDATASIASVVTEEVPQAASLGGGSELKTRAALMQAELGTILNTVKSIKDNCTQLKSENKSLQEYIESLMTQR